LKRDTVWPRRANIVNITTGRALDSTELGYAYNLPYNEGDFQKWRFKGLDEKIVLVNNATGRVFHSNYKSKVYTCPEKESQFEHVLL
jgi:hypothetical protein